MFIGSWNGVSIITALCRCPIEAKLVSNASGSLVCGAYYGNRWVQSLLDFLTYLGRHTHYRLRTAPHSHILRYLGSGDGLGLYVITLLL